MSEEEERERWPVSASWLLRDTEYVVSSRVLGDVLEVQVEEALTTDQWKGRFEAKHVEELTRKTGNYKQFSVFVNMLESAIKKTSDAVALDLLTYSDLEALRDKKSSSFRGKGSSSTPGREGSQSQAKRYLILTYSVEFDRIHYPLALPYTGQADAAQLRDTIRKLSTELEKYKRMVTHGKKHNALTLLQKNYEAVLREKDALEETVHSMQSELHMVHEEKARKDLRVLKKVIKTLEDDSLRERNKHQRYANQKNEEMRALVQELNELRSSERTLRSRVKNLTNELSSLRKGFRSGSLQRHTSSHSLRTPPGTSARTISSRERRIEVTSKSRTSSPRIRTVTPRFDPSAYVRDKKRKQREIDDKIQRLRSPAYQSASRSSSAEKVSYTRVGRPPASAERLSSSSRKLWASAPDSLKGSRTRYGSLSSLSGRSSKDSSRASSRRPSISNLSDAGGRSPSALRGQKITITRKRIAAQKVTPNSAKGSSKKHSSSLLNNSTDMSEIDARLQALQNFMKRSLEASKSQSKR